MFRPFNGKKIRDVSIRSKLIVVFLLISIIPILALGLVSYAISARVVEGKEVSDNLNKLELIKGRVDQILKEKQFTGIKFSMDNNVMKLLGKDGILNKDEKRKYEFEVEKLLYDYSNINGTLSINLIGRNNMIYTNDKFSDPKHLSYDWEKYSDFVKSARTCTWQDVQFTGETYVIPMLRKIVTPELETIGLLNLNLKENLLADTYRSYELNSPIVYYVLNDKGNVISTLNKNVLGKNFYKDIGVEKTKFSTSKGYFEQKINNLYYLIIYSTDESSQLSFISLIPKQEMLKATGYIKTITLFVCILLLFASFIASITISNSITQPLRKLIGSVENVQRGDMNFELEFNRNDEIGKLGQNYGSLLQQLKITIDNFYDEQTKKREAEIRVLEFQINPHFLYNTLSSVIWLCEENENRAAIKMTKALSNFFRISISKGKELITVNDELNHVGYYLEIQKMRYSNDFEVQYEIEPYIRDLYTPKIILQPLVENAIYHGIRSLKGVKGLIIIKGYKSGCDLIFEVWDNGNTTDQTKLDQINAFLRKESSWESDEANFGIGISNVNDRISMYFGSGYGLFLERRDDFTVAVVRIKALTEGNLNV